MPWNTIGVGILGIILGVAGYPFFYRIYLTQTAKAALVEVTQLQAMEDFYSTCGLITINQDIDSIEKCTNFYTDYIYENTQNWKPGQPLPFASIHPSQIELNYKQLIKVRSDMKMPPIKDLIELSHGAYS